MDDEKRLRIKSISFDDNLDYSEWPKGFMDQTNKNYNEFIEIRGSLDV